MQQVDDQLILSASDLINFLECKQLTWLDLEHASGRFAGMPMRADSAELVARKGDEHERRHLEELRADLGVRLVEIVTAAGYPGIVEAAERTRAAMRAGAPVIFQATFLQDGWRGHADFLERIERPSLLGEWSYEVVDTKLARSVKPYFIVQLCLYSEFVAAIQGAAPREIHVILGTGERKRLALADFAAYYRRMRQHFQAALEDGLVESYPHPIPHCGLCRWSDHCDERRTADDHLSLVARLGRPQLAKLEAAGVSTVAQLAELRADACPPGIGQPTFDRLRQQARLQVDQRETGRASYELLEPELDPDKARRGFALLPRPSAGRCVLRHRGRPVLRGRA